MLFSLDICVNRKAPPTHSLHWALNPSPEKRYLFFFSFLPSPLINFQTIQAPLFLADSYLASHGKELQAVVVFSVSKETKFELDTTSMILSYLYHFGNVKRII